MSFSERTDPTDPHEDVLSSDQLLDRYGSSQEWRAPFGHTVLVANSKNSIYERVNAAGQPIMEQLATELLERILRESPSRPVSAAASTTSMTTSTEDS